MPPRIGASPFFLFCFLAVRVKSLRDLEPEMRERFFIWASRFLKVETPVWCQWCQLHQVQDWHQLLRRYASEDLGFRRLRSVGSVLPARGGFGESVEGGLLDERIASTMRSASVGEGMVARPSFTSS